jgi:hypothetical protein
VGRGRQTGPPPLERERPIGGIHRSPPNLDDSEGEAVVDPTGEGIAGGRLRRYRDKADPNARLSFAHESHHTTRYASVGRSARWVTPCGVEVLHHPCVRYRLFNGA